MYSLSKQEAPTFVCVEISVSSACLHSQKQEMGNGSASGPFVISVLGLKWCSSDDWPWWEYKQFSSRMALRFLEWHLVLKCLLAGTQIMTGKRTFLECYVLCPQKAHPWLCTGEWSASTTILFPAVGFFFSFFRPGEENFYLDNTCGYGLGW